MRDDEVVLTLPPLSKRVVTAVLGWSGERERERRARERAFDEAEGDVEFGVGGAFYDGNETVQRTKHAFVLLLALLIGAAMPALALFLATDMTGFLLLEGGLAVKPRPARRRPPSTTARTSTRAPRRPRPPPPPRRRRRPSGSPS